jgi:hypothetical protein
MMLDAAGGELPAAEAKGGRETTLWQCAPPKKVNVSDASTPPALALPYTHRLSSEQFMNPSWPSWHSLLLQGRKAKKDDLAGS